MLAVARRNLQRPFLHGLLSALQLFVALLDLPGTAARGHLVLAKQLAAALAARFAARLCRWPRLFLDNSFLARHRDRPRLVPLAVLHGDLLRSLGLALRFAPAIGVGHRTGRKRRDEQME